MKRLALALLFPASVLAAECVLQDRTVTSSTVRIEERSSLREDVVPAPDGGRRCMVNFKARVGATWYWAQGHYDWPGDRPRGEACAVAVARAEDSIITQVAPTRALKLTMHLRPPSGAGTTSSRRPDRSSMRTVLDVTVRSCNTHSAANTLAGNSKARASRFMGSISDFVNDS